MNYRSLNGSSRAVDFREATLAGLAEDLGLFFPVSYPAHSSSLIASLPAMTPTEIALTVMKPFVGDSIPYNDLARICEETISFPIPLIALCKHIQSLELYHGPTMAFKDIGARFMSRCIAFFNQNESAEKTILVATSGDTGGAVAAGFHGVEGVRVVILYPSGRVSALQEKQLTTWGDNVFALEVKGSFDDCQRMVKEAFANKELAARLGLTSANSINVARWLPQQIYYFLAAAQYDDIVDPIVAVPSGNFGNLAAGILAWKTGLPVSHFIAACNENDVVSHYLNSGVYRPRGTVATISNAMDVGDPSNFIRIKTLFNSDLQQMRSMLSGSSATDEETANEIQTVLDECGYLLDPHGAVGHLALSRLMATDSQLRGYFLATAHPAKFAETMESITGFRPEYPNDAVELMRKDKKSIIFEPRVDLLIEWLYALRS